MQKNIKNLSNTLLSCPLKPILISCCFIFFQSAVLGHYSGLIQQLLLYQNNLTQPKSLTLLVKKMLKKALLRQVAVVIELLTTPYEVFGAILYTVLANQFADVYKINSLDDKKFISENQIQYIFIPQLESNSSSEVRLLDLQPTALLVLPAKL